MVKMRESIRRFGLEYLELPDMVSNVSVLLRVLTLNIDSRNKKPIPIICYVITATLSFNYIYVYVLCGIWSTFWHCCHTGDLVQAMVAISLSCTSEVAVIKLFYMIVHKKKFQNLIDRILACDSRTVKGSRFTKNLREALRNVKMRAIIYWAVLNINGALYVTQPIVTPGRHLSVDTYILLGLEPMFESPNFEIASAMTGAAVMFVCYTVANVTGFLILIIGYTEAQMLALSEEMTELWEDANDHYQKTAKEFSNFGSNYLRYKLYNNVKETEILNKYVKKHLMNIIEKHAVNVNLLKEIEDVMRGPNAVGFLFLIVGLIAELLGGLNNTMLQLPFTLVQLGVDCYLGQKIMDANIKFERAVYDCKWENFDQCNKKIVLVMLQNSQKTMTLSAGGMATLSFSYFMNIIRSTYSAYTALAIPIFFYFLTIFCGACYFYVYLVSMVWFVFCRCPDTGDVLAALIVFSLGIASEISTVKFLYILINIKDVRKMVAECLSCDSQVVPGTRFSVNLLRTLRAVKKRAMLFWIVIIGNGFTYVIKPILLPGRHFMDDVLVLYGLEPMFETPNYQISFVLMAASDSLICYLSANISAFLIIITGYVQGQMLALSEELTHVWDDAEEHFSCNYRTGPVDIENDAEDEDVNAINDKEKDAILNSYVKDKLRDIAKRHAVNINLLRQIEGTFRGAIAIEFCLLIVALIAELLGGLKNTYMEVPFALMQVGMDCLIGQRLMDAGAVFEDAVYDCKWERFSKRNMKTALIMLVNAQKPMTVSAGGVTTLSYVSFMTIIKSIYSTYTTLSATMDYEM